MQLKAQGPTIGLLLACVVAPAYAYNPAGHYFTVNLVTHEVTPPLSTDDARLVAFCAQLPDMSSDLDATVTYLKYSFSFSGPDMADHLSSVFDDDHTPPASLHGRQMMTVQQLIHALTGGQALDMQRTAAEVLVGLRKQIAPSTTDPASQSNRAAALCALGFGYHLFGDSYAHSRMADHHGRTFSTMYATGTGHFQDGHYPDYPLCAQFEPGNHPVQHCFSTDDKRTSEWKGYMNLAAGYLGPNAAGGTISPATLESVQKVVHDLEGSADDWNDWQDDELSTALLKQVQDDFPNTTTDERSISDFIRQHHSQMPCEAVLKDAFAASGPLQGVTKFACWQVWQQYYPATIPPFDDPNNLAARAAGQNYDKAYCEPFVSDTDYCGDLDFTGLENRLADPPEQ